MQIYGLDDRDIDADSCAVPVHRDIVSPLKTLVDSAQRAGFELCLASGYRSFERQLNIWNSKARAERTVFDSESREIEISTLSNWEKVQAILRWSALPGASRHHWGSDIDVYDAKGLGEGEKLQLTLAECEPGGPFYSFHRWLDGHLRKSDSGFFRPYDSDRGGVSPEPWHLSYRPLSTACFSAMDKQSLAEIIAASTIELKAEILEHMDFIFEHYVVNVAR